MPPLPFWKLKAVVDVTVDALPYRPTAAIAVEPLVHDYFNVALAANKTVAVETHAPDCSNVAAAATKTTAVILHLKLVANPHLNPVVLLHHVVAVLVVADAVDVAACSHAVVAAVVDATPVVATSPVDPMN